jgi:hypothetical protein
MTILPPGKNLRRKQKLSPPVSDRFFFILQKLYLSISCPTSCNLQRQSCRVWWRLCCTPHCLARMQDRDLSHNELSDPFSAVLDAMSPPASVRAVKSPTTSPTCSTACCRNSPHSHPSTPAATQPFYQQPHRRITILRHEVQTGVTRSHLGDAAREPAGELHSTRQRGKPGMKCSPLLLGVVKALLQQRTELPTTFLQLQISSVLPFSSMASTRVLRRRQLLTPNIGTRKGLTCGPSLVKKCHSAGKSPQRIR